MENQSFKVLSAEDTKESGKTTNIPYIKQEHENEAQSSVNPHQGSELEATIKVENSSGSGSNDYLVTNIVKCELIEFESDAAPDTFSQNHVQTVKLEAILKTKTEILSDELPFGISIGENNALYNIDTHSDSNLNSDPEYDPFEDIDCDSSSFLGPESSIPNFSATQVQSINSVNVNDSSNLPSSSKSIIPAVKHKGKKVKNNLQCQLCLNTQTSKSKLMTHLEICAASHENGSRFCVHCNSLFQNSHGYKRHAFNIHGIKGENGVRYSLKCELCPKSFLHTDTLTAHLTSCHKINSSIVNDFVNPIPFTTLDLQCKLCLETQSSESTLKTHVEICAASHKNRYRFCELCNRLFSTPQVYRKHAFGIHGTKQEAIINGHPFKCQLCPCSFAVKESLIAHSAAKHESSTTSDHKLKLRPFNCLECALRFKRPYALRRHILTSHSGELPVKCQVPHCEKAFKSTHSRSNHVRKCHSSTPFKCQAKNCQKAFKTNGELQKHQRSHKR